MLSTATAATLAAMEQYCHNNNIKPPQDYDLTTSAAVHMLVSSCLSFCILIYQCPIKLLDTQPSFKQYVYTLSGASKREENPSRPRGIKTNEHSTTKIPQEVNQVKS